jgi:PadR family transcriptional regulator PadR
MAKRAEKTEARDGRAGGASGGALFQPRLHGDLLTSSLLAFLRRWNAYGYQLVQELGKAGLANFDSTTVYRTLRQLERAGLVSSFWDTSESGPARRMYSLTRAGETFLELWLDVFGRYQRILQSALDSLEDLERPVGQAQGEADSAPAAGPEGAVGGQGAGPRRRQGREATPGRERPRSSRKRGQNG